MKKFFINFVLILCLFFPLTLTGCGKNSFQVAGKIFGLEKVGVQWARGVTPETRDRLLAKYNCSTNAELFAQVKNKYTSSAEMFTFAFANNGTVTGYMMLSGTYTQDGKDLSITMYEDTITAKINRERIEIQDTSFDESEAIVVTIFLHQTGSLESTEPTPEVTNSVVGKTFVASSVSASWAPGTTQSQKNQAIQDSMCSNQQEFFARYKQTENNSFITFNTNGTCVLRTTGMVNSTIDGTYTETNSTVTISIFGYAAPAYTKNGSQLTNTQTDSTYPYVTITTIYTIQN